MNPVERAEAVEAERDILKEALRVAREERDARPHPNNYQFVCGLLIVAVMVIFALAVSR